MGQASFQQVRHEIDAGRIWELRPLLSLKQNMTFMGDMRDALQNGRASLGAAHRIYSLGLDALIAEQSPALQSVGLRVYEMSGDTPRAYFEVSEEEEPRVLQMSSSKSHLEPFARGLAEALSTVEKVDQECELRLFRVPALNFEALWINYEGETKDVLVPLRAVGRLTPYKAVPLDEAFGALREAAEPLGKMDEKMGA